MPDLAIGRTTGSVRTGGGYGGKGVTYKNFALNNYLDAGAYSKLNDFGLPAGAPVNATAITKIGTAPRSASDLRLPGTYNLNASLQRSFDLTRDRVKFVFRADCFNVTNKVTFTMAQTQTVGASFGKLSGFSGNRRWQFSGRIQF